MLRFCLLHTAKHKGVIVQVLSAVTVLSASLIFMLTLLIMESQKLSLLPITCP